MLGPNNKLVVSVVVLVSNVKTAHRLHKFPDPSNSSPLAKEATCLLMVASETVSQIVT